jgi:tyrosyl-tRNA synthetase
MWRYYELLTDVQLAEIERMKREAHPMQAKKDLARRIVADFHSSEAAAKASEDWARQFQKDEVPEELAEVRVDMAEVATGNNNDIRLDRLLARCGLADSVSDAARKLKQGSVRVEDEVQNHHTYKLNDVPARLTIRVGKRMKAAMIE